MKKPNEKILTKLWAGIKYYAAGLYNKFEEDHIWIMSASIAFNIIICIIPFILIVLSVLGLYLSEGKTLEYVNENLDKIVGITPELKSKISNIIVAG
ncbi:MAG: hypothetical protein N2510_09755, partial [Ignavibacteria bacterium]|nr:hypothetical protein [Ignavibacteria bacterium]